MRGILSVAAILAVIGFRAEAASFDCAKAGHPVEKAICADASLSKQDETMAGLYRDRLALLSPDGQQIFKRGQKEWLGFTRKLCGDGDPVCVGNELESRIRKLETEFRKVGPFTFMAVERHNLRPVSRDNPFRDTMRFSQLKQSVPRIDAPNPDAERWNRAVLEGGLAVAAEEDQDDITGFEIQFASPRLISARLDLYTYGHGAAHGNSGSVGENYLLGEGRALQAADIFAAGKWGDFLRDRAIADLKRQAKAEDTELFELKPDDIRKTATDPKSWLLRPEGLIILFQPYEVGPGSFGLREVVMPWKDLSPFLKAGAPIP